MGNPHAVLFMDEIDSLELETIGPKFEFHKRFPDRTNTEFVKVIDRTHVKNACLGARIRRNDGMWNGCLRGCRCIYSGRTYGG